MPERSKGNLAIPGDVGVGEAPAFRRAASPMIRLGLRFVTSPSSMLFPAATAEVVSSAYGNFHTSRRCEGRDTIAGDGDLIGVSVEPPPICERLRRVRRIAELRRQDLAVADCRNLRSAPSRLTVSTRWQRQSTLVRLCLAVISAAAYGVYEASAE
jgi:hypothetical protein